jgi:hypothetical protein
MARVEPKPEPLTKINCFSPRIYSSSNLRLFPTALQLDFNLAIRNAYSVAQCAMHNGLGFDKRPP